MPNTKSAIRRVRRVEVQTQVNRVRRSKYRATIKQMHQMVLKKKKKEALNFLPKFHSQLMKIAKTGVIKKKLLQERSPDLQKK